METIFDHNPSDLELKRFGGKESFEYAKQRGINLFKSEDDNYYQIGLLFSMRGDRIKANEYWSRIKHKEILATLVQDIP